ncbi:MAG TPA: efflux RND transporter periplasmic adaptor subunit [Verrucomicrobiae bacterium]|jgi:HlyD family secretion protein|nr:efflux RND transporter periplasmic adaptor subunit [Verrucomicrobiae bacterium]
MAKVKSRKGRKIIVFSVIVLVLAAVTAVAIVKKKEVVIGIQKEKVTRRNITELVVANGKIQPVTQVKISPEVSGEILELPYKEGEDVKKGDLLVSIRPDNYVATRNSSLANYKYSLANSNNAAASLEKALLEYQRNQELYKTKLISDSDYLTAKTAYDVAKATLDGAVEQVGMAAASLQSAESDLSKTKIFSPLAGRVTKLGSQVGERVVGTAMMAGTEIMTVSDLSEIEARVDIGEDDVVLIAVGQKARLEVDAFKDRKFEGIVTDIANSAKNNDTSTTAASSTSSQEATKFQVKIRVKAKELFLPGMSVTAEIETRSRTNVLTIPIQCVTTRVPKAGDTNLVSLASTNEVKKKFDEPAKAVEVVFVVNGDRVKATPVKRGISDENYVEITQGLTEGQEVVTGSYRAINRDLEDGKKVIVAPKTETAKTGGS